MSGLVVKLSGDWHKLQFLLSAAHFSPALQEAIGHATRINAAILRREIRKNIRSGVYASGRAKNRPLTEFIKGSSKALVDTGQLFQAITSNVQSWGRAEVGVARTSRSANVARIVHEGTVIPVTEKMRAMFRALAEVSNGTRDPSSLRGRAKALYERQKKGWVPLKLSTTHIMIPARPFIQEVINDPTIRNLISENWLTAASSSIAGVRPRLRSNV